jgi:putative addiction module component (TIGR02574 family)
MAKRAIDYEKLSIAERLQLVEDIWDSIADETEALPLTDAQKAELDRRLEQYRRDPDSAIPWEQVREELNKPGG